MNIRPAVESDCVAIAQVYNHYVEHTIVTFEEAPVSVAAMTTRLAEVTERSLPWLVVEEAGRVVGYACATPWKTRSGYRFSAESTIYVDPAFVGRGLGSTLYRELLSDLRSRSEIHAVIGGIALPNAASIALHERCGMSKVAHFREVGYKFGRWIDVAYWQLTLREDRADPPSEAR
jgi:L-amino acid N-acyltransferase YncA